MAFLRWVWKLIEDDVTAQWWVAAFGLFVLIFLLATFRAVKDSPGIHAWRIEEELKKLDPPSTGHSGSSRK